MCVGGSVCAWCVPVGGCGILCHSLWLDMTACLLSAGPLLCPKPQSPTFRQYYPLDHTPGNQARKANARHTHACSLEVYKLDSDNTDKGKPTEKSVL